MICGSFGEIYYTVLRNTVKTVLVCCLLVRYCIEIDCLFDEIAQKKRPPAAGGLPQTPDPPTSLLWKHFCMLGIIYIYYNLLKIISGRQGHWRNHCCVLLYCISSFFIKYPVQYCTYHYRILIFDIQLDRADTSPRLRDILSSIAEPSAHPRAFYDRL